MKNFFTLLFVFSLYSAGAANYYFSSLTGDDSRTSAQARSASTPWKTISKLNSFFSSLLPGDSVLLKRGETFSGPLIVTKSGTVTLSIVISAYGSGNKPVITSLVSLTNWISKGNGIWESFNPSLGTTVNTVLINGTAQQIGRYPNSDVANKGYLTISSHTSNSITDNSLASFPNWTGAELVLRARRWVIDRCPITSHSGNTLTYAPASSYGANDGYGYFIQNDIKTLDKFGEWYFNPSSDKMSVYFGPNNPSSYVIQATSVEDLIVANNYSNIVFDNLAVTGANSNGFNIRSGSNINIQNCDISFSGVNGVLVKFHTKLRIENCTITNSNDNGINLGYSGDYATIRNNKITNTSVFAGMGGSGDGKGFGIQSNGNNTIIEYNQIVNTGYVGINFNGDSTVVKNNLVDGFCVTKDDGSGIYTFTGDADTERLGRKVVGNIIINGMGAPEGINSSIPLAVGVYMDDNSSGVDISGNTIANVPSKGIFLHNARFINVDNNTVFNNGVQLHITHDTKGDTVRNCIITNNNFFSKFASQDVADFISIADDNSLIGTLNNNYYARPIDDRIIIGNSYVTSAGVNINENLDLEGWKSRYNQDSASKRTARQIEPFKLNGLIGANKIGNGTFNSNISGLFTASCTALWANSGLLDGGYAQVIPYAKNSSVYMRIGPLGAGKKYLLKYSMRGAIAGNMTVNMFLRKDGSPYNNLTVSQTRRVKIDRTENQMLFYSSTDETAATVTFSVDNQSQYYLDNIQVYEVDATITNIDDSLRFDYNSSKVPVTVNLAGKYVDVKGNKYLNSIVLQPFTSSVLIKDGGAAVANKAPTINILNPAVNAIFAAPASIVINADAADSDGTISKVDFYNGNTFLGTAVDSPYVYTWNNIPAGNYSLTAKATDNGSMVTTSAAVAFTVYTPNIAPSVTITNPINNSTYAAPASITINATAADTDGTISKVDFYNGNTLLGTDTAAPYIFTWNNVPAGNYSITAKATDNGSLATMSSSVPVTVYTPNVAPSVSIISPNDNTTYAAPASVTINVAAADTDGTVTKVEFYNGSTLLGTDTAAPYVFTWNNVPAGNYSITVKATDNGSLVTTSAAIAVTVYIPNIAPTVSITSPNNNATYISPASITINATANDTDGTVTKVEFYNGNTLLATDTAAPYVFTWDNVPAGNYSITAKATDNGSLTNVSAAAAITVLQNIAPVVAITSPVANAKYIAPATIFLSASASDADGTISKVEIYNGTTLLSLQKKAPYTYSWVNVPAGTYTIIAKATDNGSLVTTSSAVTVTVDAPNVAPSVGITSPNNNATFAAPASVTINATAADIDGTISKVDFYNGNILLGTVTAAPYAFTWSNVPTGNYSITAKATDNGSLVTTSAAVAVTVYTPNVAPSVSITSPNNNSSFAAAPASVTINATATDTDGTISKVEFYNGNTLLGTDTAAPYVFTWDNVPAGNYSITAKATDNGSLTTISAAVAITVLQNIAPVVAITSPVINAKYTAPATIFISASASDADGTISKVEIYNGTTLLSLQKKAPYTYSWLSVPAGTYTITAKATDNKGAVTTSVSVLVLVQAVSLRQSVNNIVTDKTNNTNAFQLKSQQLSKEDYKIRSLKIYPNPAVSKIKIDINAAGFSDKKGFLNIQNILGITLKSTPVIISGTTIEADVSFLRPGIYIASIVSDATIISRKFIKN